MYSCEKCGFIVDHEPTKAEFARIYPEFEQFGHEINDFECPRYKANIDGNLSMNKISAPCRGKLIN